MRHRSAACNPFRVDRLEALTYRPELAGTDWPTLMQRLEGARFRAAMVGPHGTGKTTLLEALADRLAAGGHAVRLLEVPHEVADDPDPTLPLPVLRERPRPPERTATPTRTIWLVDRYERLNWRERVELLRRCPRLIVTAHRRTPLPTLLRTRGRYEAFAALVTTLTREEPPPPPERLLREVWRAHRPNIREALRAMYDLWASSPASSGLLGASSHNSVAADL